MKGTHTVFEDTLISIAHCFIFLKLQECERRWYEGEVDIDELVFLAASSS